MVSDTHAAENNPLRLYQPMLPLDHSFDLPPAFEGIPVEWSAWEETTIPGVMTPTVIICPAPKPEPCGQCRSTAGYLTARGDSSDRFRPLVLFAWRCRHCRHDQVWDVDADEVYDLEETDYTAAGSISSDDPNTQGETS